MYLQSQEILKKMIRAFWGVVLIALGVSLFNIGGLILIVLGILVSTTAITGKCPTNLLSKRSNCPTRLDSKKQLHHSNEWFQ